MSASEQRNSDMVSEFHSAFRLPVVDLPDRMELNLAVLREEVGELADAMADGDRVAATHELADVVYVAYEIAATYSLPLDAAFVEVHRANMSKLDDEGNPVLRADGKVLKGPNYRKPDIAKLVEGDAAARSPRRVIDEVDRLTFNAYAAEPVLRHNDHDQESGRGDVHGADGWWGGS